MEGMLIWKSAKNEERLEDALSYFLLSALSISFALLKANVSSAVNILVIPDEMMIWDSHAPIVQGQADGTLPDTVSIAQSLFKGSVIDFDTFLTCES